MFQLCHEIRLFPACVNYNLRVSLIELLTDSIALIENAIIIKYYWQQFPTACPWSCTELVIPVPLLIKVASDTRPCSKLGGTWSGGGGLGGGVEKSCIYKAMFMSVFCQLAANSIQKHMKRGGVPKPLHSRGNLSSFPWNINQINAMVFRVSNITVF